MKKWFPLFLAFVMCLSLAACGVPQEEYDAVSEQLETITFERDQAIRKQNTLTTEKEALEKQVRSFEEELAVLKETNGTLQSKVDELTSELSAAKQKQEDTKLATESSKNSSGSSGSSGSVTQTSGGYVYIPRTGSKYHSTSTCSNMKNPSKVLKSRAIDMGYGQCKKCW